MRFDPSPLLLAACSSDAALAMGGVGFEVACSATTAPPEWIQLTPRGAVMARDGRKFKFDPEKLAAAFNSEGIKLPIDFEHEGLHVETLGPAPARGWIEEVEARAEGLFGRVDWLPAAIEALQAKAYRYISPTFWREADMVTARLLKSASLCASPALGMPAVASSQLTEPSMKKTLAALGLAETATDDEAVAALSARTPDPAVYVPVSQLNAANTALAAATAEIKQIKDAAELARCTSLIDDAVTAGKVTPAARDHYLKLAQSDFAACSAAIDAMPSLVEAGAKTETEKRGDKTEGSLSPEEAAMCSALGLTEDQFKAAATA